MFLSTFQTCYQQLNDFVLVSRIHRVALADHHNELDFEAERFQAINQLCRHVVLNTGKQ